VKNLRRSVGNNVTNVYAKFRNFPLRINPAIASVFLITYMLQVGRVNYPQQYVRFCAT